MNTRFSPSLNGSLHLGHLYMAWVNREVARLHGGEFILRFDDLAPRVVGDRVSEMPRWAAEAEELLCKAGLAPGRVSYLSDFVSEEEFSTNTVGGRNQWYRSPDLEGHLNLTCCPSLVEARVKADIEEEIGAVIRGEELLPELQLYEYFNDKLGGRTRELIYLPRLRVHMDGRTQTLSKTVGNLQLRDLFAILPPEYWMEKLLRVIVLDSSAPPLPPNLNPNPVFNFQP